MDSSVTPTSPSEMAILVAGLLIMLFGVYKVYRERGRPGLLILWGGLVDLGLALMGLGLGPSGDVGSIMIMIFCSMMLSQTYVVLQIPQAIVESVFSITDNSFLILLLINLILLFVGMIVNDTTGIILVAPLLLPLAKAIGLDPIQYAAIFGVNLAVGSLTPPYASLLYLGIRIGKVDFVEILPYVGLFLLGYVPVMLLTTYWPDVSLFIPRLFGFI